MSRCGSFVASPKQLVIKCSSCRYAFPRGAWERDKIRYRYLKIDNDTDTDSEPRHRYAFSRSSLGMHAILVLCNQLPPLLDELRSFVAYDYRSLSLAEDAGADCAYYNNY